MTFTPPLRRISAAGSAAILALGLAACTPAANTTPEGTANTTAVGVDSDIVDSALQEGGDLLVWGWDPTMTPVVEAFEEAYPNVSVDLVNVGSGTDEYIAIQNAVAAGSGVPDVAQMSYYAIPQFSAAGSLADLVPFGAESLVNDFAPGPWDSVRAGEKVVALPTDSGPQVMVYNKQLFDKLGIAVPTTWDEYIDAARAIRAADPNASILADTANPLKSLGHMWAAGGRPFAVDGTEVSINFDNEGTAKYVGVWQTLLDEQLLSPVGDYTDEWYQGLGSGTIATMVMGAWITPSIIKGMPGSSGQWRVAPLPQFETEGYVTSELGGSSLAVMEASKNQALAYGFVRFANQGAGAQVRVDNGSFPAQTAVLKSPEFLTNAFDFYGDQQANEVFVQSSDSVGKGWSYLPFQVYANSIFADYVGPAYNGEIPLDEAINQWADALAEYGEEQGFTVVR